MQGSPCPSQRGDGFLEKSFVHDTLVSWGSMKVVSTVDGVGGAAASSRSPPKEEGSALAAVDLGASTALGASTGLGAKKPLSDCWPLGNAACEAGLVLDLPRFAGFAGMDAALDRRRFSGEFRGLADFTELVFWLFDGGREEAGSSCVWGAALRSGGGAVAVFFLNMSLIVCLLSNSGNSFPERGRTSFTV